MGGWSKTLSPAENIGLGRGVSQEEIEQAARAANIHNFITTLPEVTSYTPDKTGKPRVFLRYIYNRQTFSTWSIENTAYFMVRLINYHFPRNPAPGS